MQLLYSHYYYHYYCQDCSLQLAVVQQLLLLNWGTHSVCLLHYRAPESWASTPVCSQDLEVVGLWEQSLKFAPLKDSRGWSWMIHDSGWVLESGWGSGKVTERTGMKGVKQQL